ncbi:MAG TPA: serine/threonine-protein kinase [Candidatus Saccharimonadales bacterium]|nr:serine/threonine-protein kinase [Candidatus Saccharimonadales bacterium]
MSAACTGCGGSLPAGSRFCPLCGASVSPSSDAPTRLADGKGATPPASPSGYGPFSARGIRSVSGGTSSGDPASSDPHGAARFIPGAVLAGRYRIVGLLGKGGMGEVYRADDLKLGQAVALKFLPEVLTSDAGRLQRFYNEVRVARQVSHANVCRVHDIGDLEGQPFLSMEYIDGEDLSSLLKRIGRLPSEKAIQIARQICAGVAAAHDKGILHRDLKPANILIDGRGHAHITDFGLAGLAHELVGSEVKAGTPAYMAPEQLAGREVTVRSDVYSLGLVLYELFTGKAAWDARSMDELLRLQTETTPASPSRVREGIDAAVDRVILRCLEKNPSLRPSGALAVAAALPGGDPLAAALAAGETPSPQMVADAGEEGGLRPRTALVLLSLTLAGLVLQVATSKGTHEVHHLATPKPPEVLAAEAGDMIRSFGYEDSPVDSAFGFGTDQDFFDHIRKDDAGAKRWDRLGTARPSPFVFWYRQSPRPLVPIRLAPSIGPGDPPVTISGMVGLELDTQGRLTHFVAMPPQVDPDDQDESAKPDWKKLFDAAGLDIGAFEPVAPHWNPLLNCHSRAAWKGVYPDQPDVPIRVEACGYGSRPVSFLVIPPWTRPSRMEEQAATTPEKALSAVILTLLSVTLLVAGYLAWRSLRQGRGDRKGGFRLAAYIFLVLLAGDLLRIHYVADFGLVIVLFTSLATSLLLTALVWMLYVAVEPWVRRLWPEALISWSRLLAGRFRDARIGRDLLVGGSCHAFFVVLTLGAFSTGRWLNLAEPSPQMTPSAALVGGRMTLALYLTEFFAPLLGPLFFLFTLLVLRVIFKKQWLAASIFLLGSVVIALLAAAAQAPTGARSVWLYGAVFGTAALLQFAVFLFVLIRFGYLAAVFTAFFGAAFALFPIGSALSNWYTGPALLGLLPVVALAFYGFHISRAGRPIFSGALLPE